MYMSGPIIAAFVVYHLMQFTFGVGGTPYRSVRRLRQRDRRDSAIPVVAIFYIIAMALLCLHLRHGLWSMFQTLGFNHPRYTPRMQALRRSLIALFDFLRIYFHPDRGADAGHSASLLNAISTQSIPSGPIEKAWDKARFEMKLVNPANKRKYDIIVVGLGLAGGSAAATLAELGYNVKCFCFQDSPRRAHSIAAQGGINAAKNYQNDGDSIYRLFYDTVKGGDFRSREANVYRLAQISVNIIDQCVAQGVPFAREYGGTLANRSFGGAQVSRTFYARGQTGQQLLLGAYQALERQVDAGRVTHVSAHGNARPGGDRRPRARHRHARPGHRRDRMPHRPMRWCSAPAATATSTIFRPTPKVRTAPPSGAPTSAARRSPIPASRRFIRPAFRSPATINPSSR